MTKPALIEFFFDISSPYAYLASTQINDLARELGCDLQWRPFLIGGAFQLSGNEMPARVPAKAAWMQTDLAMNAAYMSVPFVFPAAFPINTIGHLRALLHIDATLGQEPMIKLAQALYEAYWTQGVDVSQPATFAEIATTAGFDPAELAAAAAEPAIKEKLKANTSELVERGGFGAPTFFVGDAMFWGHDRLDLLAYHLRTACGAA